VAAIPRLGANVERLAAIPGQVPPIGSWPTGCRFAPRCDRVGAECAQRPKLERGVRCWRPIGGA